MALRIIHLSSDAATIACKGSARGEISSSVTVFSVRACTDVYAFGVILYQMLCGRLPFAYESMGALMAAHLTEAPPPPTSFEPSIPPAVEQAILQALVKDPAQRFASVEALVRAIGVGRTESQPVATASTPPMVTGPSVLDTIRAGFRSMGNQERLIAGGAGLLLLLALLFGAPTPPRTTSVLSSSVGAGAADKARDQETRAIEWDALLAKLREGKTCKDRKAAALALMSTNDKRALEPLRRARERKGGGLSFGGGFALGQSEVNACMRKELDAAIRKLDQP